MERQILHVDVNNAFLSWTAIYLLENGYQEDIRNIPAVIGGDESRRSGIVLAKSMKAKDCGVVTGETLYQARIKCPKLKVFLPCHKFYHECSDKLYNLLLQYTEYIERFSVDECFLDMTDFLRGKNLMYYAKEINSRVKDELGFTVNIGVSTNKVLAKMASDFSKPDKIHTLYKEEIERKLWNLPVSELFMLGKKTVPKLYNMGIRTIGDLAKTNPEVLNKKFGKMGNMLFNFANGVDNSPVNYLKEKPKGIGNSITLPYDFDNLENLYEVLYSLVEETTYRLRKEGMFCTTVNVQLRTNNFTDFSHQGRLTTRSASTKEIFEKAKVLLNEMYKEGTKIRLVGVRLDHLEDKEEGQISLFDNKKVDEKQKKIDDVLDMLKNKYGYSAVSRACKINMEESFKNRKEV